MADSRYPYTYAADFIRTYSPISSEGCVLSRSGASQIREAIAKAIGMDDEELAAKLADAQLANEQDDEFLERQTEQMLKAMRLTNTQKNN
jgi:hypothetical protein